MPVEGRGGADETEPVSRLNHACSPNLGYYFDSTTLSHRVYAVRDIFPGEELTISYVEYVPLPTHITPSNSTNMAPQRNPPHPPAPIPPRPNLVLHLHLPALHRRTAPRR